MKHLNTFLDLYRGSIRTKIVALTGLCMLVSVALVVGMAVSSSRSTSVELATDQAVAVAREQSARVEGRFGSVVDSLSVLATSFSAVKDENVGLDLSRDAATGMLRIALANNPNFTSIFTVWEPDAFDDMDVGYVGTDGHDATGRLAPMLRRAADEKVELVATEGYEGKEEEAAGHFYLAAKASMKPFVSAPMMKEVAGEQKLVCRVTTPIVAGGTFYGIVGADLDLAPMQVFVDAVDVYGGEADVTIMSPDLTVIGMSGAAGNVGKNLKAMQPEIAPWILENKANFAGASELSGGYLRCVIPFRCGTEENVWFAQVKIPGDLITAEGSALAYRLLSIGTICALLALGVIFFVGGGIAKPVKSAAAMLKEIASGDADLSRRLPISTRDELADLAHWFNELMGKLEIMVDEQEQQATVINRFKPMIENSPTVILSADKQLRVNYINDAALRVFEDLASATGRDADSIIGEELTFLHGNPASIHSHVGAPGSDAHRDLISVGPEKLETMICRLENDKGEHLGFMMAMEVVTKKLESEERVREQSRQMEAEARDLRQKVDGILAVVQAAENGDLTQDVEIDGDDAIGQLGGGLGRFFATLRRSFSVIAKTTSRLTTSSAVLDQISLQMGDIAEKTSSQATAAANIASEVDRSTQNVAAGAEEMNYSILEIAKSTDEAARVAQSGVTAAQETTLTMQRLGQSSSQIGEVIKVINSIAEQTNLLALNATIEAARAGEAGKGFAVVATEVKELAKETADATQDISDRIEKIQDDVSVAVEAIEAISKIINDISGYQTQIASAVEEQSKVTNEIGSSVNRAASGTSEIAANIAGVAEGTGTTTMNIAETRQAATELAQISSELQELISQFRTGQVNAPALV